MAAPPTAIDLRAGETVLCTFIDLKQDTLIVEKQTQGGDGAFSFTSPQTAIGNFSLSTVNGGASKSFPGLVAGTYSLSEVVPAGWNLNNATCDNGDTPDKIQFAPGQTVKCRFVNTKIFYTITASVVGGKGGVSCTPGTVASGGASTCTAIPADGYQVSAWGGACSSWGSNAQCFLTKIKSNQFSTVSFAPLPVSTYTISATVGSGNGTLSCTPTSVSAGGTITCTALPDPGYQIANWTGACASAVKNATCVITNVTSNQVASVNFVKATPPPNSIPVLPIWGAALMGLGLLAAARRRF
jgi:MYXO-CTERM domain-containing protein